jgi:hypothetical protein
MIIGFKKQFVEPILQGTKVHTIRDDPKKRWRPGLTMHLYTGGRFSKEYRQFNKTICISVQTIRIRYVKNGIIVLIDNKMLSSSSVEQLALNDGFENVGSFLEWFNKDFEGKIIHWTVLSY